MHALLSAILLPPFFSFLSPLTGLAAGQQGGIWAMSPLAASLQRPESTEKVLFCLFVAVFPRLNWLAICSAQGLIGAQIELASNGLLM